MKLRLLLHDGTSAVFEFSDPAHARAHREGVVDAHKLHLGGARAGVAAMAPSERPPPPSAAPASHPVAGTLLGRDTRALRAALLSSRPKLRAEYDDLVGAGVITDATFWATDTRAALQVDASLVRPAMGLSSRAPSMLLLGDPEPGSDPPAPVMTQQMQLAVFKREPAVSEAFHAFVPPLSAADFWTRYLHADSDRLRRRLQLEDGLLAAGGGPRRPLPQGERGSGWGGGASAASRPLSDIRSMRPDDFFDSLQRGEFPPLRPRGLAQGDARRRSNMPSLDSSFELLATVEESARAAGQRGGGAGGYGTSEVGRAYEARAEPEALAASSSSQISSEVRLEEARRRERLSAVRIYEVNAYSAQVVDCLGDGPAAATPRVPAVTALPPRPGTASGHAAAAAPSYILGSCTHPAGAAAGSASMLDDLPDLYSRPMNRNLLPLCVDLRQLKASLAKPGEEVGVSSGDSGRVGEADHARVKTLPDGASRGDGGWSQPAGGDFYQAATQSPAVSSAGTDSSEHAGESTSSTRKRLRETAEHKNPRDSSIGPHAEGQPGCLPSVSPEETTSFLLSSVAGVTLCQRDPHVTLESLAGKSFLASARRVLRELTVRAHDLFESADRSARTGISRAVPRSWQDFIEERLRLNCELLALLWPLLAENRSPHSNEARAKLLQRVHAEYRGLQALKLAVLAKGAHALLPPANGGRRGTGSAVEMEVYVPPGTEEEGRVGTSDTVNLLNMLAAPLDAAIQVAGGV